jgi:phytoene synthase
MPTPLSDAEERDLAACRSLLKAGSRSFDAAARLLPRSVRDPAIALYAFCRVADDEIDGATADAFGVDRLRERLTLIYEGRPTQHPSDRAMAWVVARFGIPRALPEALLEGFAWDAEGRRYDDLAALRAYAVRVAGTVGAMMAVLMGVRDRARLAAAIDLGVAMQLSNIARDVGEDARAGRLYLPQQWLLEEGIDPGRFVTAPAYDPALASVVRRLLDVADTYYNRAKPSIARLPLGCRLGIAAAALLYAEIGREVRRRSYDSVSGRAVVSRRHKIQVIAAGLPRMVLRGGILSGSVVPEGAFLVAAVNCRGTVEEQKPPRWKLSERALWVIDLFTRLEQRQNARL